MPASDSAVVKSIYQKIEDDVRKQREEVDALRQDMIHDWANYFLLRNFPYKELYVRSPDAENQPREYEHKEKRAQGDIECIGPVTIMSQCTQFIGVVAPHGVLWPGDNYNLLERIDILGRKVLQRYNTELWVLVPRGQTDMLAGVNMVDRWWLYDADLDLEHKFGVFLEKPR